MKTMLILLVVIGVLLVYYAVWCLCKHAKLADEVEEIALRKYLREKEEKNQNNTYSN